MSKFHSAGLTQVEALEFVEERRNAYQCWGGSADHDENTRVKKGISPKENISTGFLNRRPQAVDAFLTSRFRKIRHLSAIRRLLISGLDRQYIVSTDDPDV